MPGITTPYFKPQNLFRNPSREERVIEILSLCFAMQLFLERMLVINLEKDEECFEFLTEEEKEELTELNYSLYYSLFYKHVIVTFREFIFNVGIDLIAIEETVKRLDEGDYKRESKYFAWGYMWKSLKRDFSNEIYEEETRQKNEDDIQKIFSEIRNLKSERCKGLYCPLVKIEEKKNKSKKPGKAKSSKSKERQGKQSQARQSKTKQSKTNQSREDLTLQDATKLIDSFQKIFNRPQTKKKRKLSDKQFEDIKYLLLFFEKNRNHPESFYNFLEVLDNLLIYVNLKNYLIERKGNLNQLIKEVFKLDNDEDIFTQDSDGAYGFEIDEFYNLFTPAFKNQGQGMPTNEEKKPEQTKRKRDVGNNERKWIVGNQGYEVQLMSPSLWIQKLKEKLDEEEVRLKMDINEDQREETRKAIKNLNVAIDFFESKEMAIPLPSLKKRKTQMVVTTNVGYDIV